MTGLKRERLEHELHPEDQILKLERGQSQMNHRYKGIWLPTLPNQAPMVSTTLKMSSSGTGKSQVSSVLDRLNRDEQLNAYSWRFHSSPEKDGHVSRDSKTDRISDTSSSSYHTAPGSEEAECAKDCTECLDEAEDLTTYRGSEYEQSSPAAIPIIPGTETSPADRSKISRVTGGQLQGTMNSFGNLLEEGLFNTNSPGIDDPYAATSRGVKVCCPSQGTLGNSLPFQEERGQNLQADCGGATKDQTYREKLCSSDQRNQQVQMSIKDKNNSDPAYSGRMGPGTRRLQPGDGGSQCLDHTAQISSDKPKEMLPSTHKQKKNTLGSHMRSLVSNKTACPKYFVENPSVLSDSDAADSEVEKLTALSFQSLSHPQGSYLDMYTSSNGTPSSLSSSLPEECNEINGWAACSDPRQTVVVSHSKGSRPFLAASKASKTELLGGVLEKEHFESTNVTSENASGKKSLPKKRIVPKRQIQLRRKEKKEMSFCDAGNCTVLQPFAQPRKEPCAKGRSISDEFRINYKQFLKAASLSSDYNDTGLASSLVKNVLAKKMQYEQKIKMEQASIQSSSTSSAPSSVSTDLLGESLEGKSSSLSKSDCSCSTEDLHSNSTTSERSESVAVREGCMDPLRPTKGVVLNEQLKEKVCKLKNTFNELNERMKSQEVTCLKRLPILVESGMNMTESNNVRKKASGERKEYRRARAVFESLEADARRSVVVPKFTKPQKPWPNLKQRAICQKDHIQPKEETFLFNPTGLLGPKDTSQNIFTSQTKEMKLIPQLKGEHNVVPAFKYNSLDRASRVRRLPSFQTMKLSSVKVPASHGEKPSCPKMCCPEDIAQVGSKGAVRIHQPRGVRKLVNDPYSSACKSSDSSSIDQISYSESKSDNSLTVSPLFIRCTSVCRKEEPQSHMRKEKQDQTGNINACASTLSLQDRNASESKSINNNDHPSVQSQGSMSVCPLLGESVVHIASIQSKKLVVEDKKQQPNVENKAMPFKRSELHVRPSSTTKKESQLHVRVNSSLSNPLHKTETDYFPTSRCSALGEGTIEEALLPSHHSLSQENKTTASSEAILTPPSTYLQEITKRDHGYAAPNHTQMFCQTEDDELSYQKHCSSKRLPVIPRDSQGPSHLLKEENTFFEPDSSCSSCRHLQVNQSPVTNTQNILTQLPRHHHFLNSASEMTAPERSMSLEGHNRTQPECLTSDNPLRTREYTEGIKLISNSSFSPSTSYSKLHDSECGHPKNKHQATNEQYFAATQADNANYMTIPVEAHPLEAAVKPAVYLGTENPSFASNVSFHPGGETSGNKINNEFLLPKQMERKVPLDHLVYGNLTHGQLPSRHEESPIFAKTNDRTSLAGKSDPSMTRPFAAPPLQGHRKMLVDPESGKCYYVEPPRQPQLKMLYDPETGQYIEVLIPPVSMAPPSGLFPSPFSPAVMNTGNYAPPSVSYSPFQGFPPPPPPAALPVHPDFHDQPTAQEKANFSEGFNHFSKNETPPAGQSVDGNYMDSLYYIPTGMNSSPNPNPVLFSPFTNSSLSMPERGSFVRM